jgi:hypothetical protein
LKDNLMPYTDEELIEEVKEYNPELLEEWRSSCWYCRKLKLLTSKVS